MTPLSDDDVVWSKTHEDGFEYIFLFSEKQQKDKPPPRCECGVVINVGDKVRGIHCSSVKDPVDEETDLWIVVNGSLQSWLNDRNILVDVIFPESFRCIISGPGECGKTFLWKNSILGDIEFVRLYIIAPTGDQYDDLEYKDIVFIEDRKYLPPPDQLQKDI